MYNVNETKSCNSLVNGIPIIGLGTYRTCDDKTVLKNAIKHAIKIGYRHIDGGMYYY